mgnify:CR=1 FL=1
MAKEYRLAGKLKSNDLIDDELQIMVASSHSDGPIAVPVDEDLEFSTWLPAVTNDPYFKIRPVAIDRDSSLLFKPEFKTVYLGDGCVTNNRFAIEQGVLIKGSISPPVEDMQVKILKEVDGVMHDFQTVSVDQDGTYRAGPYELDFAYNIVPDKEDYSFAAKEGS